MTIHGGVEGYSGLKRLSGLQELILSESVAKRKKMRCARFVSGLVIGSHDTIVQPGAQSRVKLATDSVEWSRDSRSVSE